VSPFMKDDRHQERQDPQGDGGRIEIHG
jgi:hypothetical protein